MNKRNFLKSLAYGLATGFIAPSALTERVLWIPNKKLISLPPVIKCVGWSESYIELYNKIPFYLAKIQVERTKEWSSLIRKLPNTFPTLKWSPSDSMYDNLLLASK